MAQAATHSRRRCSTRSRTRWSAVPSSRTSPASLRASLATDPPMLDQISESATRRPRKNQRVMLSFSNRDSESRSPSLSRPRSLSPTATMMLSTAGRLRVEVTLASHHSRACRDNRRSRFTQPESHRTATRIQVKTPTAAVTGHSSHRRRVAARSRSRVAPTQFENSPGLGLPA
eukprot:2174676-Rhodomonas_salina.1